VKRREFIGLIGGAVAWPLTASAQQQGKIVTIGILAIEPWSPIETFRKALDDLGYIEVTVVPACVARLRLRRENSVVRFGWPTTIEAHSSSVFASLPPATQIPAL
jgi:hypothetical protein